MEQEADRVVREILQQRAACGSSKQNEKKAHTASTAATNSTSCTTADAFANCTPAAIAFASSRTTASSSTNRSPKHCE